MVPMPKLKLTNSVIKTLRPRSRTRYFDQAKDSPPGFFLDVTPEGVKTFYLYFRDPRHQGPKDAPKVSFRIGGAGEGAEETLTVEDAREKARAAYRLVRAGKDPREERERERRRAQEEERDFEIARREAITVEKLVARYLSTVEHDRSKKTIGEYRRILNTYVKGTGFGGLAVKDARRTDVHEFLEAVAKRGPVMAINVHKLLSAAFEWGIIRLEVRLDNPASRMRPRDERKLSPEERTLTRGELIKVWTLSERAGELPCAYVRLMLLCATRRTETAFADWSDIDWHGRSTNRLYGPTWRIPPENRKGAKGRERGLVIPVSAMAEEVLRQRLVQSGGKGRIFGNLSANFGRAGAALRKATGFEWTFHDLRATCATGLGNLGVAPHVISLVLGHAGVPGVPQVTSRYDHASRIPEVVEALELWGEHVRRLIEQAAANPAMGAEEDDEDSYDGLDRPDE